MFLEWRPPLEARGRSPRVQLQVTAHAGAAHDGGRVQGFDSSREKKKKKRKKISHSWQKSYIHENLMRIRARSCIDLPPRQDFLFARTVALCPPHRGERSD